jgi:hypothetical protein
MRIVVQYFPDAYDEKDTEAQKPKYQINTPIVNDALSFIEKIEKLYEAELIERDLKNKHEPISF